MLKGMVLVRDTEGQVKRAEKAKVVVFGCGFEATSAEAKGTILISNATELLNYNKSEERKMEEIVSSVASCGCNVVIVNGTVSEMALHFLDKHNIMVVKVSSKFDTKRLCSATGCTALLRLGPATPEEMGYCSLIEVREIASRKVIVFTQELDEDTSIATIVLRASTENVLNDLERSIDDGVHAVKALMEDGRLLAGAGAVELEVSRQLKKFAEETLGLDQYGIKKFAEALDVVPRTLVENSGCDTSSLLHSLHQAHDPSIGGSDAAVMGFDVDENKPANSIERGIYDIYVTKLNAMRLAVDAALTILKIDQIVMSKPAGGPKPRDAGPMDI
jgi:T-complex protein 1 subunit theta